MKKIKGLLSVFLSALMLLGCIPFAALASAEESDTVYTIFAPSFTKLGGIGADATAVGHDSSYRNSHSTTKVAYSEDDGYYFNSVYSYDGSSSLWNRNSWFATGVSNNTDGMSWMGDNQVVPALGNLAVVSFKARVIQTVDSGSMDSDGKYQLYTSLNNDYNGGTDFGKVDVPANNAWNEFSVVPSAWQSIYSGYFGFKVECYPNFTGTISIDFKDIRISLKESDREAVNTALSGTDWDFDKLIAPYKDKEPETVKGEDIVIYKSNPLRAGAVGSEATVEITQGKSLNSVYVASDDGGTYFTYSDEYATTGQSQWNRRHYFNMGYDDKFNGLGWISDSDVMSALAGKITVSMKLRISVTATSGNAPTSCPIGFNVCHKESTSVTINNIGYTTVNITGDWVELKFTPTNAIDSFYSGYLAIWNEAALFDGVLKVDIKDIQFTLNTADKKTVDTALEGTDYSFDTLTATFDNGGLENPDEGSGVTEVIWYANPDKITRENGGDVSAEKRSSSSIEYYYNNSVSRVYDEDGVYYSASIPANGNGGNSASAAFVTGYEFTESLGYGWLNSADVLTALKPYVYLSTVYRVDGVKPSQGTAYLYMQGVNGYSKEWGVGIPINDYNQWMEYSMKSTGLNPVNGWYETDVSVNLYAYQGGLGGTYAIDIKDLRWELKAEDRVYINKALSEVDEIDSIPNFTEGVELETDVNGYKDYYSLLTGPTRAANKIAFDVDDDGEATLLDLVRLKKYEAEIIYDLGYVVFDRADYDKDEEITAVDIAACKKALINAG